ncbi:stalk domain-containing protein [Paenibacillus soyae]|uniref:Stalk domain-containing protein n=1 Tax=Paenibacillus soyae TaxID=2969249 RepID=A0A9X2SC19_9BACL|nr:stalk domain-containing protein [Paenibacillus soyae]MCR2805552.1 stalk domain-containing protein [Paenibacillus soyae]
MFSKAGKLLIASAITAAALSWSAPGSTYAALSHKLDKGLENEIREELGLPLSEPVTEDEVHILTQLSIDAGEDIRSLKGLEQAYFLHTLLLLGAHEALDLSALADVESLELLAIDRDALSKEGRYVVDQLEENDVAVVDIDPSEFEDNGPIEVYIDGELAEFQIDPVIISGSTMVQFRPLFEQFGLEVGWDQATRTVTGTKEKLEIELVIDSKTASVSGQQLTLPTAPKILTGNTMVPLRFIGEATGRRVTWDGETRTVYIDSTVTSYNFEYLYSNDTEYFGAEQNGLPHGEGRLLHNGKLFYEGDFKNGIIEGSGIMYDLEDRSSYYEGEFKNNRFNGQGTTVYSDGSYYEGPFVDGMREGSGKLLNADDSLQYAGMFSGDALNGKGTYYFDDTSYYVGSFTDGSFDGQGKMYYEGELKFEGIWYGSNRGIGKEYYDGKLGYEGYFFDNVPNRYGTVYLTDNGEKYYRGQMKDGQITGVGMFYLDDEARYIGEVFEDKMDGYGFIKEVDGTIHNEGYWVNDEFYGEDPPPVTEDSKIKSLSRNSDFTYADGYYENEYDLSNTEAMMFIQLSTEEDLDAFNSLSKENKAKFMNGFVQDRWGHVLGVDNCYVYVMYDEDVYAEATLTYQMADSSVQVAEYPRGNGTINE